MAEILAQVDARYGNVAAYLQSIGLAATDLQRLRKLLTEAA